MPRVVHFEIYADNPERAIMFYENVFNWKFSKWENALEYWLISTREGNEPGIDGTLVRRTTKNAGEAIAAYPCTIDVPSLDEYLGKVISNGGSAVGVKTAIIGVGWFIHCKDTERNLFGMIENNKDAK
jgi:predicted enzyme related to lactoylglutathione lyase